MIKRIRIWLVSKVIELNEKYIFERRLLRFYKNRLDHKPNLVIDVGANTGQSIDLFLKLNPKCEIISFEPNPRLYKKLKDKYSNNPNIRIFDLGISDEVGQKIFHENIFHATSTFEELNRNSKYLGKKSRVLGVNPDEITRESYPVNATTLSDFLRNHCHESIDILKIDTEGHEHACIKGLFKNKLPVDIKYIQLEVHYDDMYSNRDLSKQVPEIMSNNGFEVEARIDHGFGDFKDIIFKKGES